MIIEETGKEIAPALKESTLCKGCYTHKTSFLLFVQTKELNIEKMKGDRKEEKFYYVCDMHARNFQLLIVFHSFSVELQKDENTCHSIV